MLGLDWQTVQIPLLGGLSQGTDDRALQPPAAAVAQNVEFEERGGLQTRKPITAITGSGSIFGGGSITTARRIEQNGDEFLLWSKDTLYSRSVRDSAWVSRGTHLAIATSERPVFVSTGDQVTADKAELSNTVVFAWVDAAGLWAAAEDKTTRAVIAAPTLVNAVGTRPRLVALSTKILLFWIDTAAGDLECIAIDPASVAAGLAGAVTTVQTTTNAYYDVVRVPSADTAIGAVADGGGYVAFKVTAALAVSTSAKARACDGPIAVSCPPTGTSVQIVRTVSAVGSTIVGDLLVVSSLADTYTAQAIGTTVAATATYQIAAAHRSTQDSSQYRCYVFWHCGETSAGDPVGASFVSKYNWVDTGNNLGTEAIFVREIAVASRAFDYDGRIFLWMAFAGESASYSGADSALFRAQLQNSYFLYRDDATLHAKAVWQRGGGFGPVLGHLPSVSLVSGTTEYAWCAIERRIIELGGEGHTGYADRGPREVSFAFDDNRARRCVRLGNTLYMSGAEVLQYDRASLAEVGFETYPYNFGLTVVATGNLETGVYAFKATPRWDNAAGERERGTTATHITATVSSGSAPDGVRVATCSPLFVTRKTTAPHPAIEFWRTPKNPSSDSPFYLVTDQNPADTSNPNRYIPNAPTSASLAQLDDEFADSTLTTKEANPENGAVLENLAPPPATIIAAYGSRLFLAGIPGEPRRVWYSKQRNEGEVAAFHEALTFELPLEGGDITAVSFLDGILIAFCETAIYAVAGEGFDNTGGGVNYGPARAISYDVGCRDHDSVVVTPLGIAFASSKGFYLLNRGFSLQYIGSPIVDYDSSTVLAAHCVPAQHQVRFVQSARILVWDYSAPNEGEIGQWAEWPRSDSVHAALWQGTYHVLSATGPSAEQTTFTGVDYGMVVETPWIKPMDLQGAIKVRKMKVLGEYRSAHVLKAEISYDYSTTVTDTKAWTPTPTTVGGPLELVLLPSRQECQAVKVKLTAVGASTAATMVTSGLSAPVKLVSPTANWTATLSSSALGTLGNSTTFSIAFVQSTTAKVYINNHFAYDVQTAKWVAQTSNLGVLVMGNDTTATVTAAVLEAAITSYSQLGTVTSAHASPSAVVDFSQMANAEITGAFAGGAFASPTGESLKLTGLALEVGLRPGVYKRLPATQRA